MADQLSDNEVSSVWGPFGWGSSVLGRKKNSSIKNIKKIYRILFKIIGDTKNSAKQIKFFIIGDSDVKRRSTLSIRLFLKEFCVEFLHGAYNKLMYVVRVSFIDHFQILFKVLAHDPIITG